MTLSETPVSPLSADAREAAIAHFAAKLRYETDPSDVAAALAAGERFTLVDVRNHASWHQGRAVGAVHLPRTEVAARAPQEIPLDTPVVVYCWSPGCNGADKAALEFAMLGYEVRLMIGGFEYWAREGFDVVDDAGPVIRSADPLVIPTGSTDDCGC
ncbi:rhodanese-like domain-containing protein [Homoserinibacter sp. GY 40078]|uniref:rhodanese-like domain-containing protein n=1 Tax=Homoserinibacter sp. GY 40078 TaxID=2603275 RepID=UPI0011C8148F|nr:rhodanese-like domain-containing protein [Homoserinibacter sp. GY 40078]TXK18849.1 sulfurtransferase [Homoserinibacter sp. GY 40078]